MDVTSTWHGSVIEYTEKNLRKNVQRHEIEIVINALNISAKRQSLFEAGGELWQRLEAIAKKACKLSTTNVPSDCCRFSLELLRIYALYCNSEYFASSLVDWSSSGLGILKSNPEGEEWKGAKEEAWNLISAIFSRAWGLLHVKSIKRDGAGIATKVGTLFKQRFERKPDEAGVPALLALKSCLVAFPSSLKNVEGAVKGILASVVLYRSSDRHVACETFAMLPRIRGETDAWSRYAQEMVKTMHSVLDDVLAGIERENSMEIYHNSLDPNVPMLVDESREKESQKKLQVQIFSDYFEKIQGAQMVLMNMMTLSYAFPVALPIRVLIQLAERLLSVDIVALSHVERSGRTSGQKSQLCTRLADIQVSALIVMERVLVASGTSFVAHVPSYARIIKGGLETVYAILSQAAVNISDGNVLLHLLKSAQYLFAAGGMYAVRELTPLLVKITVSIFMTAKESQDEQIHGRLPPYQLNSYAYQADTTMMFCQIECLGCIEKLFSYGANAMNHKQRLELEDLTMHITSALLDLETFTSFQPRGDNSRTRKGPTECLQGASSFCP